MLNTERVPDDYSAVLREGISYFEGKVGKSYLNTIPNVRFQRAEEEGNAFAIMLYDLPANSDLVGEPVSRLLEYDNMTLALWGITKSNFKECLFAVTCPPFLVQS